jgi:hypothetical protein
MPLVLQKATPADAYALVEAQFSAFYPTDPLHAIIYPGVPSPPLYDTVAQKDIQSMNNDVETTWLKIVDTDTGSLAAAAKWSFFPTGKQWPPRLEVAWEEGSWERWVADEFWNRRVRKMEGAYACLFPFDPRRLCARSFRGP